MMQPMSADTNTKKSHEMRLFNVIR